MTEYVNLGMSYTTYSNIIDALMDAVIHAEGFYEIQKFVHIVDLLEKEYLRDCEKQKVDCKNWEFYENLLIKEEKYHPLEFQRVKHVLEDYENKGLLEWNISKQNKFHLICELIDVFKKEDSF